MRIISGQRRGLKLNTLEGENTRPTLDRVKESLFNILMAKGVDYENILDLFAGSGNLGLEALSRGGEFAVFCDNSSKACEVIRENIEKCKFSDKSKVLNLEYKKALEKLVNENIKFDIIFLDPPYNKGFGVDAIELISKFNLLNENGYIILETNIEENIPHNIGKFNLCDEREYGIVKISIFN
ncbi:MAG: 16S rRNA (guanine(966)-N(2))-methyltransferase RsmD [Clostridiales bacterium]|nr:16S rRNA (guanine(966)-N(2))-methyltransferase RsmD [Clostridiales bacterium]